MELNLLDFGRRFRSEASCIAYLRKEKEATEIICRRCGSKSHYWNSRHLSHDCKKCGHRLPLRVGTLLEGSKLPFRYWIYTLYLMTMTKKGFSALELQRQLGHKRYEPIWAMMHKIRSLLGKAEQSKIIGDNVEMKNLVITTISTASKSQTESEANGKKNNTKKKRKVRVIARVSEPHKPFKKLRRTTFRWVRFLVEKEEQKEAHLTFFSSSARVAQRGILNSRPFFLDTGFLRQFHPEEYERKIPWAVALSGNAKRIINGIHHHVGEEYLQNYLDEFSYKTNHRNDGLESFSKVVKVALAGNWWHTNRSLNGYTYIGPFPTNSIPLQP